jgi:hypothetical protein
MSAGVETGVFPVGSTKQRASVEAAIDEALRMTFPASDPPAWGCIARIASDASADPPHTQRGP